MVSSSTESSSCEISERGRMASIQDVSTNMCGHDNVLTVAEGPTDFMSLLRLALGAVDIDTAKQELAASAPVNGDIYVEKALRTLRNEGWVHEGVCIRCC